MHLCGLAISPFLLRLRKTAPAALHACTWASAGSLPSTDEELLDWIEARLRPSSSDPASASTSINYNLASEYYPGACVRVCEEV